jgi:hypothetical protein
VSIVNNKVILIVGGWDKSPTIKQKESKMKTKITKNEKESPAQSWEEYTNFTVIDARGRKEHIEDILDYICDLAGEDYFYPGENLDVKSWVREKYCVEDDECIYIVQQFENKDEYDLKDIAVIVDWRQGG